METSRTHEFLKKYGIENWGDYSHPPIPYKEEPANIMGGFFSYFAAYGVSDIEFRQVWIDHSYHTNVHICVYHDAIFMIEVVREKAGNSFEDNLRVWRVGCKHKYKSIPHEKFKNCEWLVCEKCGHKTFVDYGD